MRDAEVVHAVVPLSPRQRDVIRIIIRFREATGETPSERYLARRLGIRLSVVQGHLAMLYRKGWLVSPTPAGLQCLHDPEAQSSPSA